MHQSYIGDSVDVNVNVREVYRALQKAQTHLVQSGEIATAGVCQHLFKLSYPFGVVRGERDYLVANAVHDIMSLAVHGPILENWIHKPNEHKDVMKSIVRDSASITEQVTRETKEYAIKEARNLPESFEHDVADRFQGLVTGITKHLMRKYERPKGVITEVTVTNILNHHEGRIDAILEFDNGGYGILDWKTYNINRANGSGHERWQLLSNILLSNFRYTNNEDDWSKFLFASIVYYEGAYMPRLPISEKHIAKIKNDRFFAHQVLCGNYVRAEKPRFCPVCDTNAEGCSDCHFYREDSKMAFAGQLPDNYRKITGQLFGNRYKVLQGRAETHRHKHVVDTISNSLGEAAAIRELERYGILHSGYKFVSANGTMVRFRNEHDDTFLEPKKVLRVIGKEDNILLLSCISEQATVMQVNDCDIVLSFRSEATVERAKLQLFKLPLIMLRDEINLTRRMLEPLHKFHKLAADFLVPRDNYCTNAGGLEDLR